MADPAVDRQLGIQVSCIGLPSTVKLKGLRFPEMRVISQLCLKMCQQPARWTQPASFLAPQTIYIRVSPTEIQKLFWRDGEPRQNLQCVPHHKSK